MFFHCKIFFTNQRLLKTTWFVLETLIFLIGSWKNCRKNQCLPLEDFRLFLKKPTISPTIKYTFKHDTENPQFYI